MTDKEIKSAMEACLNRTDRCVCTIEDCPYAWEDECSIDLWKDALDLIDRQQAEIDRLNTKVFGMEFEVAMYKAISESSKSKAIKEFAEKLKDVFVTIDGTFECWEIEEHIDNIVKEMVGADND